MRFTLTLVQATFYTLAESNSNSARYAPRVVEQWKVVAPHMTVPLPDFGTTSDNYLFWITKPLRNATLWREILMLCFQYLPCQKRRRRVCRGTSVYKTARSSLYVSRSSDALSDEAFSD